MDPAKGGRLRGFRAPGADPADPQESLTPEPAEPVASVEAPLGGRAETMSAGPPARTRAWRWPTLRPGSAGPGWRWAIAAGAALVVAMVVIAGLAFRLGAGFAAQGSQSPSPKSTPATTPTPLAVTDLYRQVVPSVVVITTSKGSLGSGTVVTDTGTVLTAHHVIAKGGAVSVVFADGTKAAATVVSSDPKRDIATLRPAKLPEVVVPATLGGEVAVGADVVAMGNPLGLRDSTTTGVVSGLDRRTASEGGVTLTGLIQFDAAVNPGSSGGPLLDAQGHVVGVVVSIADPGKDDAFAGIGFAVPIGSALGGGSGDGPGGGPRL